MGIYRIVNVPTAASKIMIKGIVDGEQVRVIAGEWLVTDTFVGEHMFKPENHRHLRRMYANDLATVIRLARDIGYEQALAHVRDTLGIYQR